MRTTARTANAHYIVKSECAMCRAQIHLYDRYLLVDIYSGVYVCARPLYSSRMRTTEWTADAHYPVLPSLKVQVSFAEYHLLYRALLQKRPII